MATPKKTVTKKSESGKATAVTSGRRLTFGQLQQIDSIITIAQENGLNLGDVVKSQSEVCCCGAIAAEAKGKFVFTPHDREIVRRIADLESQIESAPTLGQLIEARGKLLQEANKG